MPENTIRWDNSRLYIIDQTLLPTEFREMSPDEFLLGLLGTWVASWPSPGVATPQL